VPFQHSELRYKIPQQNGNNYKHKPERELDHNPCTNRGCSSLAGVQNITGTGGGHQSPGPAIQTVSIHRIELAICPGPEHQAKATGGQQEQQQPGSSRERRREREWHKTGGRQQEPMIYRRHEHEGLADLRCEGCRDHGKDGVDNDRQANEGDATAPALLRRWRDLVGHGRQ
jgi:hypothetical protein